MQIDNVFLGSRSMAVFSASLTPAATAAASAVEQAFTLPSSIPTLFATDHVSVTGPGSGNSVGIAGARINSSGQLVIQFINPTAGSLTYAAGAFIFKVTRA